MLKTITNQNKTKYLATSSLDYAVATLFNPHNILPKLVYNSTILQKLLFSIYNRQHYHIDVCLEDNREDY